MRQKVQAAKGLRQHAAQLGKAASMRGFVQAKAFGGGVLQCNMLRAMDRPFGGLDCALQVFIDS
ncbi:hypothetical protein, partial [Pseudomonas sp. DSP3-2-2]|uniref:hypothetical protein n=1 Tax=Pseudomonas sp. DSP3-2-2 TaxID=2804614 RepID=UPI003CF291CF